MKYISRIAKKATGVFLLCFVLLGNTTSGDTAGSTVTRIPVWVFLETMPGATSEAARTSLPPKKALNEVSRFLLSGLVFGWDFSYTPYDKRRNVDEYFEIIPKYEITANDTAFHMSDLTPAYPYLYCYAEYSADILLAKRQAAWKTLSYKTVQGSGIGERSDEVQGIYTAYINATKDAVRRYAQDLTKNKPREVRGQLLIRNNPRLFMKSGQFHANLEMYIFISEIIPYEVF